VCKQIHEAEPCEADNHSVGHYSPRNMNICIRGNLSEPFLRVGMKSILGPSKIRLSYFVKLQSQIIQDEK
jgi:secreted Zn-dependent insulinase-like peptidase